jgi:hypothetical protein
MSVEDEECKADEKMTQEVTAPSAKDDSGLPLFDDFCDDLGSWKPKLKTFVSGKTFKSIYDFLKKEYASKTV